MYFVNFILGHKTDALKVFSLYNSAEISTKFFLFFRLLLTPYQKMSSELPKKGKILDHGCGHGLFSIQLAFSSAERNVVGIDHDENRIKLAESATKNLSNLKFYKGSLSSSSNLHDNTYEGVALIDVLHYFNSDEQLAILKNSYSALSSGGTVVFREVNPNAGIVSKINFFWEKLATISKFTKSKNEQKLTFRIPSEWEKLLKEAGFSQVESKKCSSIFFADVLFKGIKS